ncbi:ubiquitin-protein ligase E3C [Contarinia nasturtii]|uniref:ubiquitin-protein ligase E3C n=1 Tax=Contarinia nasturtii TaxID=265458 RepID=UPI0012D42C3C|nr:ubiquitin-protein ligase E3C [Contarinia nasturtii]
MFSFEGNYKRTPSQNLSGASHTNDRETLIRRAQHERQKRAEIRKQHTGAITIQSCVRSFLSRVKCKKDAQQIFDQYLKTVGLTNPEQLEYLLRCILFFYDNKNEKDGERLIILCQFLIRHPDNLLQKSITDPQWQHRVKKLLSLCIQQLSLQNLSHGIPFRTLETFSSDDIVSKYITDANVRRTYLESVYRYLVQRKYFKLVRQLLEEKIPPLYDVVLSPPNSISETLLQMIQHPLRLMCAANKTTTTNEQVPSSLISKDCANLILSSFVEEILVPKYTKPIQLFVIPCLANSVEFPFPHLLQYLSDKIAEKCTNQTVVGSLEQNTDYSISSSVSSVSIARENSKAIDDVFCSSYVFHSFMTLDQLHLHRIKNNAIWARNYINVLGHLSENIRKLQPRSSQSLFKQYDTEFDADDDIDSDEEEDRKIESISMEERDCLLEAITFLNDQNHVEIILDNIDNCLDDVQVLYSLCKICHNLMLYHRTAVFEFRLLFQLTFRPQFIRALWYTLHTQQNSAGFSSPLSLITKGIQIADHEIDRVIPMIASFCALFGRLIATLHDREFCQEDVLPGAISKIMPFKLNEIISMSSFLKDMSLGLVELAFPETRTSINDHYRTALQMNQGSSAPNATSPSKWPHLLKVCVSLLRQLHTRDLRRGFCPPNHWVVHTLNLPLDKPTDLEMPRGNRHAPRPFQPIRDFTREDFDSNGPPLSTKQVRSITILREIPFVVPFNTRVGIFQGLLAADRLRAQGDQQSFLQGPSIQLVVRRSHLYEDAFDKLRQENEPDLRARFRVQMINNIGLEEVGIDGGGVFREFLSELIKTAFDPNRGFFMITTDNKLYPNPSVAKIVPDYQKHYYFIGRMLGKALYENLLVELPLAEFFLSKLAGKHSDVDVHQLDDLDPVLHRNLLSLKAYEGDVEELGLDFTVVINELGETKVHELKPNGTNIQVTSANRIEYISLMADYKLNRQIRQQCAAFRKGLANVVTIEWLYMFSNKEFQVLISGAEIPVDIDDLRENTKYGGDFEFEHPTIKLFWEVLTNFSDIQKRQLLKFVTSCSRPPLLGFKDLDPPFTIHHAGNTDRLPSASTCMNLLKLPAFNSKEQMREKLLYAIESNSGFELS